MKKQHLLAQSQELFSPQNAYHKFIECMKYFVGPRPVGAVEEVQKYLDKIIVLETDLYENSLHDILLNYSENIIAIKFFLMSYLSVVASRVFRFDEKGNETKIGEFLMEDAQKLLPKLKTFIQNDHVLHLKLSHIYCQIRLLNLNLDTNMETIDELFREARVWKEKCGKTRECMYFKTLLGALFTNLSFRADRWHDADLMACQIWEDFSENDDVKALKYDPGISLELAQICQFHFEKAALVHNTEDEIRYRKKALWYFKNAIGKIETTEAKCRFSQRSAVQALHEEKTVLGCVKARTHRKALKHINQSHLGWKKMIRESQNNLKHSRYFSHLVYYNYLKYQIKPDLKYFKNMEAVFAELSSKILGSPEVDNLEIIEAMLRMTCQMKSFSRAVEICSNSKKIRNHDKLMYPFGPILKLVEQISLLKTFPDGIVLNKPLSQNEFEKTILQLKKSKNPICSFWYDFGINVYFDFLQKSGESLKYEQMWNFANKIKHFSMETLCSWQSSNSCLKNSSVATVTEILEVPVTDMVFDLLVFAEVSIHSEILSSTYSLMSNSATRFNVPSDKFRFLTNEKLLFQELDDYVWSNCEAQLVLIVQASGSFVIFFSNSLINF